MLCVFFFLFFFLFLLLCVFCYLLPSWRNKVYIYDASTGRLLRLLLRQMAARLRLVENTRLRNVHLDFFRVINLYLSMRDTWAARRGKNRHRDIQRNVDVVVVKQYDIVRMF